MPRETPDASARSLDLLLLPLPPSKEHTAGHRERRECNRDRKKDAARPEAETHRQKIGKRDLPEPKHEEVDHRGRPCVARAVEGLHEDHAPRVKEETRRNDAQA